MILYILHYAVCSVLNSQKRRDDMLACDASDVK